MLQFLVHLIYLLNIFLRCNGFTIIQKAIVDLTSSRQPVTMNFFGISLAFGIALELLLCPVTELVIAVVPVKSTFCCMS